MAERRVALIIGNSEYDDDSLTRLRTPDSDVGALAEALREPEIGGFDEVTQLVNQPSAVVRRAIAHFFAAKRREDLLLLYFSGHGVLDDRGRLYLAVKDTERELLRGTAVPAGFVTDEMDNSRSRRQVLILDCCHSGAFARGSKGVVGASVGTASAFEGIGYGRVVLTASDSTQYAWEGDEVVGQAENSVFTHYLIEGLKTGEADTDGDGSITLDELYDYVYGKVVTQTPKQTPGKWSYRQQGEIVVARNPHPSAKPVELPVELRQAIESPLAGVREGAVSELDWLLRGSHAGLALAAHEALQRLAEDDSRSVSAAAAMSLEAHAEAQRSIEGEREVRERLARERTEAENRARERAEQEQLAREKAEAEERHQEKLEAQRRREQEQVERARQANWADALGRARTAMKESRWADALNLLNQLNSQAPEYESELVASLRAQSQDALQRERHWAELYAQGMKAYRDKRWKDALDTFQTLRGLAGDYKDIKDLIAAAEREQLAWKKAEAERAARRKRDQRKPAQERTQAVASLAERIRGIPSLGWTLLSVALLGGVAAVALIYYLPSPEQWRVFQISDGVGSAAWSPDGTRLLVSSEDTMVVLDAASGEQLRVLEGHTEGTYTATWSPDGKRLVSGGCDEVKDPYCAGGHVRVWDAASGQQLLVLEGHKQSVDSVAWSPDGTRLASSDNDGDPTIGVWDAASGEQLCEIRGEYGAESVAWSPDGTKLAWGDYTYRPAVRIWDALRCEELQVMQSGNGGSVLSVAWSPDGTQLATSSMDGTVIIRDAVSGTVLRQLDDYYGWISSVDWSPDGTQLAAAHSAHSTDFSTGDRTIRVWDAASGEQLRVLRGHKDDVWSVDWSPDGTQLASGSSDGTVRIWNVSED